MTTLNNVLSYINNFAKTDLTGSEANTKKRVIEPLLEFLGWDLLSNEVRLEYAVKTGTSTAYVDYALMLEDKPVLLVEAKAFDEQLSEAHSSQIISYGKIDDVQWTALTNGKSLKIFDTKAGKTEKECLVVEIELQRLPHSNNELRLLSRESMLTGEIETTARRLSRTKTAIRNLKDRQDELTQEIKKILLEIIGTGLENRVHIVSSQLAKKTVELFEEKAEAPTSFKKASKEQTIEVPSISRQTLYKKLPGDVVLCSSRVDGIEFLKKYNAWGFVNMSNNRKPKYFALYVGKPYSSVLFFAEVDSITQPLKSKDEINRIQKEDLTTFETGKRVIHLKSGSLYRLEDPIPLKKKKMAPRGLRYTNLKKLIKANDIEEL